MKKNNIIRFIFLGLFILIGSSFASRVVSAKGPTKLDWEGIPVYWLEDNRFPVFNIAVYFADGAASDHPDRIGETSASFDLLSSGTTKMDQKSISELLDDYAISFGHSVTHEYSLFSYSGLVKNSNQGTDLLCHIFNEANYPKSELAKFKKRSKASLENLVSAHGELANRVFRQLTFEGTPLEFPASGTLSGIQRMTSEKLKSKLDYFRKSVRKAIFVVGPKSVLGLKDALLSKCGFSAEATYSRIPSLKKKLDEFLSKQSVKLNKTSSTSAEDSRKIVFVPLKKANQGQVRVGAYIDKQLFAKQDAQVLVTSGLLGGSFTSLLVDYLRGQKGLTYSAYSVAAEQSTYGRSIISSFSKNPTLVELLKGIDHVLGIARKGEFSNDAFARAKSVLAGKHLFQQEKTTALMNKLISLYHQGKDFDEFYRVPRKIKSVRKNQVSAIVEKFYEAPDRKVILVLADKSLEDDLRKYSGGSLEIRQIKDFL